MIRLHIHTHIVVNLVAISGAIGGCGKSLNKKIHKKHPVGCFLIGNNFLILVWSKIDNEGYAKNRTGIAETYYYAGGADKLLAANILNNMAGNTGLQSNGIRFGNFYVLRENPKIAVLGELGHISNPSEESTIQSEAYQIRAASGIAQGLSEYFSS